MRGPTEPPGKRYAGWGKDDVEFYRSPEGDGKVIADLRKCVAANSAYRLNLSPPLEEVTSTTEHLISVLHLHRLYRRILRLSDLHRCTDSLFFRLTVRYYPIFKLHTSTLIPSGAHVVLDDLLTTSEVKAFDSARDLPPFWPAGRETWFPFPTTAFKKPGNRCTYLPWVIPGKKELLMLQELSPQGLCIFFQAQDIGTWPSYRAET